MQSSLPVSCCHTYRLRDNLDRKSNVQDANGASDDDALLYEAIANGDIGRCNAQLSVLNGNEAERGYDGVGNVGHLHTELTYQHEVRLCPIQRAGASPLGLQRWRRSGGIWSPASGW